MSLYSRKNTFWIATYLVALLNLSAADRPNILLILADDLGREAIGCYGGESYNTPNLDELATEGAMFDNFYVMPVCHPTRVALISGRYPSSLGNPQWGYYPSGAIEKETLANRLQETGYKTAAAGKWHLAKLEDDPTHPQRMGFDESCFFGWHEGPRYWSPRIWQNGALRQDLADRYGPDVYTEFLVDFIERNQETPFFAYYAMTLAHAVSDDFLPRPPHGPHDRYKSTKEMIEEVDTRVGQLLSALDQLGLAESTLVFFTTDNGTSNNNFIRHEEDRLIREGPITSMWNGEWIRGGKGSFRDWGTRVPTIARLPGAIEPGSRIDDLIDITDLAPTLLELAQWQGDSSGFEGQSFTAPLRGGEAIEPRTWVRMESRGSVAIRTQNWKWISGNDELFDLKTDPLERNPILPDADTDETRQARRELRRIANR